MPNLLYPPSRPLSVGEILDLAFRIFGATLLKCLPYSFAAVIIGQLPNVYTLATGQSLLPGAQQLQRFLDLKWWLLNIVATLGTLALANAVLLRQYSLATGHSPATAAELARGARKAPGMLLIIILMVLAVMASFIPLFVLVLIGGGLGGITGGMAGTNPSTNVISALIVAYIGGFVLLLIAASWAVVRWVCSGVVYLLTERGPVQSMSHSWHLTGGSFGRLSVIYTVGALLMAVFYLLASAIAGLVAFSARGDLAVIAAIWAATVALLGALISPFYSALVLAVFGDLSVRREGSDLAQRISAPATQ